MQRIAIIPAYKPDKELISTVNELKHENFEVIVVNDGSGADFAEIFDMAAKKAHLLVHTENQGKGEALKTALRFVKEHFEAPYVVVTADADGQHKTADIVKVCEAAEKSPDALILGSRKLNKASPLKSRMGNGITRMVYRLFTGVSVYDTQTGLRAFNDRLIDEMLSIDGSRYEYEMNVLMTMAKKRIEIIEVNIEVVYIDENKSSHFNVVKDSYRIYKEIIKFSVSSIISFLIDYGLFSLISALTNMLVLPNIIARICSSTVNFALNKNMVFKSKENTVKSAVKYFSLAACILLFNTLLLKGFTNMGLNKYIAKIFTEIILFSISYFVQHSFIFKKKEENI